MANVFEDALDDIVADAATASASLATITAGSDAVVDNFDGLKDLVDELSAFATLMKSNTFYAPVGGIIPFAGSVAPGGWFLCNGDSWATLGLTTGDDLYDLLQPVGWAGVPDLRGRVPFGVGTNAAVDALGDKDSIAIADRSPAHSHTVASHTHGPGSLWVQFAKGGGVYYSNEVPVTGWTAGVRGGLETTYGSIGPIGTGTPLGGSGTTDAASPSTNSSTTPYLALNYIIKA